MGQKIWSFLFLGPPFLFKFVRGATRRIHDEEKRREGRDEEERTTRE
jgi:hypothetical protein